MTAEPAPGQPVQPLTGIRVLELATFLAGPFCCTQLGEFGAEIIKVELPVVGDPGRKYGTAHACGDSLVFLSEARNKKSVTIDLRTPEGAAILKQLIPQVDVVVENFQVGTLEKWGLGWETLKAINPRLVMTRITGFGQTGPLKDRPGFGRIGNGFGGLSFLVGYPDRPPSSPGTATTADYLSGLYGAFGTVMALRARDLTGEGQVIDIGLYETVFRILDEIAPAFQMTGHVRQRVGPGSVNSCPHSHYQTKDGRWVGIACSSDKIFERLAGVTGQPELAGEGRWGTYKARNADRAEVDAWVSRWTGSLDRDALVRLCEEAQVPCGPVYAIDEIFEDPQYRARENILFFNDARAGEVAIPNVVPRMTGTPGSVKWLGPALGAHNEEILGGLLGLTADELGRLAGKGVVSPPEPASAVQPG
jgi:crotonobetainyl-CoA:carnitine CoA-transferase CaiB-like acyl-CoA transferase